MKNAQCSVAVPDFYNPLAEKNPTTVGKTVIYKQLAWIPTSDSKIVFS